MDTWINDRRTNDHGSGDAAVRLEIGHEPFKDLLALLG
jgi:cystathionine beta-lyase/cystathionine gamma-synthase